MNENKQEYDNVENNILPNIGNGVPGEVDTLRSPSPHDSSHSALTEETIPLIILEPKPRDPKDIDKFLETIEEVKVDLKEIEPPDETSNQNEQHEDHKAKLVTADHVKSGLKGAKEGAAFGILVIKAVGDGAEDFVPFVQIANRAIEVIEDVVKSFQKNQAKVHELPSTLKRYANIVLEDMGKNVNRKDQESFVEVAQVFMDHVLDVYKMCDKWKNKPWFKKVKGAKKYDGKLEGAQKKLETHLVEVLASFTAVMEGHAKKREGHAKKRSKAMLGELKKLFTAMKEIFVRIDQLEEAKTAGQYQFESLLKEIGSCKTVQEFIEMYDGAVGVCLDNIRTANRQSGKTDVKEWAEDWAQKVFQGDEEAKTIDRYRKLSLELIYVLLNRWKGLKGPKTITADNIVSDFGDKRVMEILRLCLPMDCANALHNMTLPGESQPGMHWVSVYHKDREPGYEKYYDSEWAARMEGYDGFPTMNKRFLWLMEEKELAGLNLGGNNFLRTWTTPKALESALSSAAQPSNSAIAGEDSNDDTAMKLC